MNITVAIPDTLVAKLGDTADLPRRVLEALVLEAYRSGRLSAHDLRGLLGFETRYEMDGFLKGHGVYEDFTIVEIEDQVRNIERLGF